MGYYYDWLQKRWDPIDHDRELTRPLKRKLQRRSELISSLITEIEKSNDNIISLYAGLLARHLASTDEILLREYGRRLAEMAGDPDAVRQAEIRSSSA